MAEEIGQLQGNLFEHEEGKPKNSRLAKAHDALMASVRSKHKQTTASLNTVTPQKQNSILAKWPDRVRATPNSMLRSSLFAAIPLRSGNRAYFKNKQVAAYGDLEIFYTGLQLDQEDLSLWDNIVHLARGEESGSECRTTSYALLKLIGKTDNGANRTILEGRIDRLKATSVKINSKKHNLFFFDSLIGKGLKDNNTQEWCISLPKEIIKLFSADQFTQIDWEIRSELSGKPLAQWLHGFYSSHAKPFPMKIENIHELCGSSAKSISDFRIALIRNLNEVKKACENHGNSFSFSVVDGIVSVEKTPSRSQKRHIVKKTILKSKQNKATRN